MKVRDAMTGDVLTMTPGRSLRDAAKFMADHNVGAVVIMDPEQPGPGIFTERDLVRSIGKGESPDEEHVSEHLTVHAAFADIEWDLEEAADTMAKGGFRHLVVVEGGELCGIISMRDIMRVWRPSARPVRPRRSRRRTSAAPPRSSDRRGSSPAGGPKRAGSAGRSTSSPRTPGAGARSWPPSTARSSCAWPSRGAGGRGARTRGSPTTGSRGRTTAGCCRWTRP